MTRPRILVELDGKGILLALISQGIIQLRRCELLRDGWNLKPAEKVLREGLL
jgi:hypothetical protein